MTGLRPGPSRRRPPTRLRVRGPGVPRPGPQQPSGRAIANGAARPATRRPDPDETVRYGLRVAAGYAWRSVAVAVAVYLVFVALGRLHFVAISVFVGLLITALLRPLTDLAGARLATPSPGVGALPGSTAASARWQSLRETDPA